MKKLLTIICAVALFSAATGNLVQAAEMARDTYHMDHRSTPMLQVDPTWDAPGGLTPQGMAGAFMEQEGTRYLLPTNPEDLQLLEVKESLLGSHFVYQQLLHGIPVEGGIFIVSVSNRDGRVYQVYNNTYPVDEAMTARASAIGEEAAYDVAWEELRANGNLLAPALSRLVYVPTGDTFVQQYIIDMELSAPYGGWRLNIDAEDGTVLRIEDSRLIRKVNPDMPTIADRLAEQTGPIGDRRAAFARAEANEARLMAEMDSRGDRSQGTAMVFDPDPRTTLMNNYLQDSNPPSTFTDAYLNRDLQDIQYLSGIYRLTGPWVYIANWDPPNTQPSSSTTGDWTATRGNNAFNDAMTYFHLDQSQRYMQSLGFTGAHGIQNGAILADSDGVGGADNSYFQPAYNRLSFGHGCVDDNEDADVILHEYGHAIQHDITYWAGGDTGAIGEGFGDYWAGSYSISTPNGLDFYPNWVYTWDGHGSPVLCWYGRVMDAVDAMYVPGTTYGAHQIIPGGYQSDELWSTPLFQTLLSLIDLGYDREEVDQIILESHFGVGYGITMRGMANATIATAELLQPSGPHADMFTQKFLVHNIVDVPFVQLQVGDVTLTGGNGSNGAADPGETVSFTVAVLNSGDLEARGITATLSSSNPLVTVVDGASSYDDLAIGGAGTNLSDFSVAIDQDFPCGDPVELDLMFSYNNTRSVTALSIQMGTGVPQGVTDSVTPNAEIPDNYSSGVTSSIVISGTGLTVTDGFSVDVRIIHPNIGDLRVTMTSASGSNLWLHNRTGGSTDNLIGNYPNTLTPISPMSQIVGQPLDGTWTLKVVDAAGGNVGTLESWGINQIGGYDCEEAVTPVEDNAVPARFSVFQNHPNPFNPMTTIEFAVPGDAGVVNLSVYDISGRLVRTLENGSLTAGHYSRVWDGRDKSGRMVSSGTYFYRLSGHGFTEARKMILMK